MTVPGRGDSRRRCCNVEDRFGVWDIRTLQALPLQVFAAVSRNLTTSAPHHQELENLLAGLPRIFLHRAEILVAIGLAVEFFEAAATWNFHFGRPGSKQSNRQHRACRQNIFGAGLRAGRGRQCGQHHGRTRRCCMKDLLRVGRFGPPFSSPQEPHWCLCRSLLIRQPFVDRTATRTSAARLCQVLCAGRSRECARPPQSNVERDRAP